MKIKSIIILSATVIACLLIPGGYSYWTEELSISGGIKVETLDLVTPEAVEIVSGGGVSDPITVPDIIIIEDQNEIEESVSLEEAYNPEEDNTNLDDTTTDTDQDAINDAVQDKDINGIDPPGTDGGIIEESAPDSNEDPVNSEDMGEENPALKDEDGN